MDGHAWKFQTYSLRIFKFFFLFRVSKNALSNQYNVQFYIYLKCSAIFLIFKSQIYLEGHFISVVLTCFYTTFESTMYYSYIEGGVHCKKMYLYHCPLFTSHPCSLYIPDHLQRCRHATASVTVAKWKGKNLFRYKTAYHHKVCDYQKRF
jgi:hypothetical protein